MPRSGARALSVTIHGALSVLGQEVRRRLEEGPIVVSKLNLFDTPDRQGSLTEFDGEAAMVMTADEDLAELSDLSFVCGEDDPRAAQYLDWAIRGEGVAVDLIGASRGRPGVAMVNFDVNPGDVGKDARMVAVPHPLAHPLITILDGLRRRFGVVDCCATILRPASDLGRPAVEELHQQTVGVLSFSELPTGIFGRQLAFNVLPLALRGEEGRAIEALARDNLRRVLGDPPVPVSLKVLMAPIFYGHCYLVRVRLDGPADVREVERALGRSGVIRLPREADRRTPAELASEEGIWVGEVAAEDEPAGSFWLWAVTDGIRSGAALSAVRIAARLTGAEAAQ
ncbi:MAG TPA: Asd/ArgC dimerization domain-containing protein [Candidatus Saccharimonadales bacterium]|nr:Asd/ArgC dimerization domain-containing protein [Candidatus Saccharimonadales bacterium]